MEDVIICHNLGISYTELEKQPNEWVEKYMIFLSAKSKAEKKKMKEGK